MTNVQRRDIPLYRVHMPPEAHGALQEVLYSGQIASGPNVARFETLLGNYLGNPYVTSTSDVSSSIVQCLYMAGVRPGDEVIASPMACLATNMPIRNLFANVVWCDIDPRTGNMDPNCIEDLLTERTRAILVYHWAGYPADLDAITQVAKRFSIPVVDDAGEALGAEYHGNKIGHTGSDFTVFSFHAVRHITTGEGAAIAFGDPNDYEHGRWLKRYGIHQPSFRDASGEIDPSSEIQHAGYNNYMNHIAATIGVTQMPYLASIVARHQENGRFYDETLSGVPGLTLLHRLPGALPAYWVYTLLAERRDDLLRHLRSHGVYASKVHARNDAYACFGPRQKPLPGVDRFEATSLSIPCGWWVSAEDRERVAELIRQGW